MRRGKWSQLSRPQALYLYDEIMKSIPQIVEDTTEDQVRSFKHKLLWTVKGCISRKDKMQRQWWWYHGWRWKGSWSTHKEGGLRALHWVLLNPTVVSSWKHCSNFTYSEADPRKTPDSDISEWLCRTSVIRLKFPPPRGQCSAHGESHVWGTEIMCDVATGIIVIRYIYKDTRIDGGRCTQTLHMMSFRIWSQLESHALSSTTPVPQWNTLSSGLS